MQVRGLIADELAHRPGNDPARVLTLATAGSCALTCVDPLTTVDGFGLSCGLSADRRAIGGLGSVVRLTGVSGAA